MHRSLCILYLLEPLTQGHSSSNSLVAPKVMSFNKPLANSPRGISNLLKIHLDLKLLEGILALGYLYASGEWVACGVHNREDAF